MHPSHGIKYPATKTIGIDKAKSDHQQTGVLGEDDKTVKCRKGNQKHEQLVSR